MSQIRNNSKASNTFTQIQENSQMSGKKYIFPSYICKNSLKSTNKPGTLGPMGYFFSEFDTSNE